MTTASPLDNFLMSLDRHLQTTAASTSAEAGPSSLARPGSIATLRSLVTGDLKDGFSPAARAVDVLKLSPLERAMYYEVEYRRKQLQRKQDELAFWEAHQNGATAKGMPADDKDLATQIEQRRNRLQELQGHNNLRIETNKALEAGVVVHRALSNTYPSLQEKEAFDDNDGDNSTETRSPRAYATTRKLLDERDDRALEFLTTFNAIRGIRQERTEIKAQIRARRLETAQLLGEIKTIKSDIRAHQLDPGSQHGDNADDSQDTAIAQQIQRLQRRINEARSKKELVKGILRGLMLESGRDWTQSKEARALMMSLDDEDDASDDAFTDNEDDAVGDTDASDDGDDDDHNELERVEADESEL
ncbi:hypothetical protein BCV70DRAFT_197873 [Testicularia cyperi]|uniref:Centromere protein H C-terminal domain-containing protein n=1 Tax=Testicularia cyperi TaxID=1882483 RepID=A0A317Y0F2_9BASI|nr:hypothetical protein BCV70DRAFT_197873 [Testicularia cyperi]